jgi:hypothetical protein
MVAAERGGIVPAIDACGVAPYHSRMHLPRMRRGSVRLMAALLALGANLVAAGAPVLHEGAHAVHAGADPHADGHSAEHAHGHAAIEGDAVTGHGGADHPHGEIHPAALHDRAVTTPAAMPFVGLPPERPAFVVASPAAPQAPPFRPATRLSSRAPPPGDPARAPPSA